jgi:hypothetical protein
MLQVVIDGQYLRAFLYPDQSKNFPQKFGKGLDEVNPFSDTMAVDIVLRESEKMLSPNLNAVCPKNASRIWGFISKFVMLDRFSKVSGVAKVFPGHPVGRKGCSSEYVGTGFKVSLFIRISFVLTVYGVLQILDQLNPPTKIIGKFLRTWGDRDKTMSQYSSLVASLPPATAQKPADVALNLSRRLIDVMKLKSITQIEAGLELIALAMAISSEVS